MEMKSVNLSNKMKDTLYKDAFENLDERTTYWDPLGFRIPGGVNLKKEFTKRDKELFEKFDKYHLEEDCSVKDAADMVAKSELTTGAWTIPTYYVPDAYVVNPQRTPFADLAPRETIDSDTINVTMQKGEFDPTWADEPTSYTSTSSEDDKFEKKEYSIKFYGFETPITDKMSLASRSLRNPENAIQNLHMKSMRYAEEQQVFRGNGSTYGYDTSGFEGLPNIQSDTIQKKSDPSNLSWKEDLRSLINDTEAEGADRENLAIFTNFENYTNIANALDDYTRYTEFGDELPFGFQTLEFDGIPIYKTKGIRDNTTVAGTTNEPYVFCVDMGSTFMGMLRDVTTTPLAKTAPLEKMATDAYGALASEATPHIQYIASSD